MTNQVKTAVRFSCKEDLVSKQNKETKELTWLYIRTPSHFGQMQQIGSIKLHPFAVVPNSKPTLQSCRSFFNLYFLQAPCMTRAALVSLRRSRRRAHRKDRYDITTWKYTDVDEGRGVAFITGLDIFLSCSFFNKCTSLLFLPFQKN